MHTTTIQSKSLSTALKPKNNSKIIPQQNINTQYSLHKVKNTSKQPNPPHTTKNTSPTLK